MSNSLLPKYNFWLEKKCLSRERQFLTVSLTLSYLLGRLFKARPLQQLKPTAFPCCECDKYSTMAKTSPSLCDCFIFLSPVAKHLNPPLSSLHSWRIPSIRSMQRCPDLSHVAAVFPLCIRAGFRERRGTVTGTWYGKAGRLDDMAKNPKPGPESKFWLLLMVGRVHLLSVVHSSKLGSSELGSDTVLPVHFTLASPRHPVWEQGHTIILLLLQSPTRQSHAALCHLSLTGPDCI